MMDFPLADAGLGQCFFSDEAQAIALDGDKLVLAGGARGLSPGHGLALVRFLADGTPDALMNGTGRAYVEIGESNDGYFSSRTAASTTPSA